MEKFGSNIEGKNKEELEAEYTRLVGINPTLRAFNFERLIAGINDPVAELARLKEEDSKEDKDERDKTYRG